MLIIFWLMNLSPPVIAQSSLAQIMAEKSLSKIISPTDRRNLRIDVETITENYDAGGNQKLAKTEHKTTDGRLSVRGISMEELYRALGNRFDFYIETDESTAVIKNTTCAIIKFKPKSNLAINKTADQFVNRTEGSIYINLDNFNIASIEGYIRNPFSFTFSWFFIPIARINVYQFKFVVEYTVFNNMLVEQSINGLADYEIRNRGIEKFTNKLSNHRIIK